MVRLAGLLVKTECDCGSEDIHVSAKAVSEKAISKRMQQSLAFVRMTKYEISNCGGRKSHRRERVCCVAERAGTRCGARCTRSSKACGNTPATNDGLAAAGAVTWPVCPVSKKTLSFGRFPQFRGVPEKSGRSTSPVSDLNDRPQGLH